MPPVAGFQAVDPDNLPPALSLHRGVWKVPAGLAEGIRTSE
jgi:hypothetical protein